MESPSVIEIFRLLGDYLIENGVHSMSTFRKRMWDISRQIQYDKYNRWRETRSFI